VDLRTLPTADPDRPFDWALVAGDAGPIPWHDASDPCAGTLVVERHDAGLQLAWDPTLDTAIYLSLWFDRRAEDGDLVPPGWTDPRGWCGEELALPEGVRWGSKLWQILISKGDTDDLDLLRLAEAHARQALQWLLDDGIAATVTAAASWAAPERLALHLRVYRPDQPPPAYDATWTLTLAARARDPLAPGGGAA